MGPPFRRRLASLAVALALLGATSAIPQHTDTDHTARERHVDTGHGGHDGILIRDTDDRTAGGKVVLRFAPAARLYVPAPSFSADARDDATTDPPFRPPNHRSRPRAPPALTS